MYSVCQLGSRMNYAVARALQEHNLLSYLYTDICADQPYLKSIFGIGASLGFESAKRFSFRKSNIELQKIRQYPFFGLQYFYHKSRINSFQSEFQNYIWAQVQFNQRIINDAANDEASHLYTYNTCSLDLLKNKKGRKIVLEQCSLPAGIYLERIENEAEAYSEWTSDSKIHLLKYKSVQEYISNEIEELQLADYIISPSEEVSSSLISLNIAKDKIFLVPYGYSFNFKSKARELNPRMKVATVGAVELRKGIHHFAKVAELCTFADFVAIGAIGSTISEKRLSLIRSRIKFTGHLNRNDIVREFETMDVLLFLSIGEGSATSIYEALSFGIPVITSQAAGSIIEHGKSGYIVQRDDYNDILQKLEWLSDKDHYRSMSEEAVKRSKYGSREAYGQRLINSLQYFSNEI